MYGLGGIARLGGLLACLGACEGSVDKLKENETAQLVGLVLDQPCVVTRREGRRLAGAYLRQPKAALGFDPIFVTGKESRKALPRNLIFDDSAVRRVRPGQEPDTLEGSRRSVAVVRSGFAPSGALPNVYDLSYRADRIDYEGPIVVGPSAAGFEVPTSGLVSYTGRIELALITQDETGAVQTTKAEGTFSLAAGYGSGRAMFQASGFAPMLPFDSLSWSNLFLCGARFVSSGQGQVLVGAADGPKAPPFQSGRDPVPLKSIFESSQFAPDPRPGAPATIGGIFVVSSDAGTLTGVFLSGVPETKAEG